MAKTYAATFLYSQYSEYEKKIFSFIMKGEELDKNSPDFEDIVYEVKKRQVGSSLVRVLQSKDVILMTNDIPLDKAFKVFCAKDIKGPNKDKMKVFIDCSNIIKYNDNKGRYECKTANIDILISYLVSAMHTLIYYADEDRICNNSKIISAGAGAFSSLFNYVVDFVCKVNSNPANRSKCLYLTSLYYIGNILGKDYTTEGSRHIAKKVSGLSDREAGIVDIQIKNESMLNIRYFVETLADILHINNLTLDVIVERWMTSFGTGTVFALEIFPAFASMMTDAYVGSYINNQKSIEKIAGTGMTEITKTLLTIGAESI